MCDPPFASFALIPDDLLSKTTLICDQQLKIKIKIKITHYA